MGHVIHLRGDAHEQAELLLPWYVTGTLGDAEAAAVEAHLVECEQCRDTLERERVTRVDVASLGLDVDHGWSALRERIAGAEVRASAATPLWRRRIGLGWAVAAPIAAAAATVAILSPSVDVPSQPGTFYQALGSTTPAASSDAIILFRPDTSAREIRETLARVEARIIDGPLASGGYLLRLPVADRAGRIGRLRAAPGVVLAEPLGGSGT